jgi:Short C-terminal domain
MKIQSHKNPDSGYPQLEARLLENGLEKYILKRIVEAKKQEQSEVEVTKKSVENKEVDTSKTVTEDPIHILKIRYAKGEISKEEYDEMRKNLE